MVLGTIDADGKIDLSKLGTLSKAEVDKICRRR